MTVFLGTPCDGATFSGQSHRLGMASHATIVNDGVGPLSSRTGIIPGEGTPMGVDALGTPAMKVQVQPGTCVIQSTAVDGGVYSVTLGSVLQLDIGAADLTNPRTDLIVAEVNDTGLTATCAVKVIPGVAGINAPRHSPTPPTNCHWLTLAQVRVDPLVTTIQPAKVTKNTGLEDGRFTCAPGGTVRGVTRHWSGVRASDNTVGPNSSGNFIGVTVPAVQCLPGIYVASYSALVYGAGSGNNLLTTRFVSPSTSIGTNSTFTAGEWTSCTYTSMLSFETKQTSDQTWLLNGEVGPTTAIATFVTGSRIDVWRVTDL